MTKKEPVFSTPENAIAKPLSIAERRKLERERKKDAPPKIPTAVEHVMHEEDAKATEAIRGDLEDRVFQDPRFKRFFGNVPDHCIHALEPELVSTFLEKFSEEMDQHPDTRKQYEAIIENGDRGALEQKCARQIDDLKRQYFGELSIKTLWQYPEKRKKLQSFRAFVDGLKIFRRDHAKVKGAFKSPEQIGKISSYGADDLAVRSDRYVYGSFDQLRHYMTRGSDDDVYELEPSDADDHGEIVMQDVANISAREPDQPMRSYLANLFDYKNGKEILALYLASVFDTPQEASAFFDQNNSPHAAQRWDEGMVNYPAHVMIPYPEHPAPNFSNADYEQQTRALEEKRLPHIVEQMRALKQTMALEPPLSPEVRIRDQATIKRAPKTRE